MVCVQGMGWKGVGVGEAFGAAVTNSNGRDPWAGALPPHPARSIAAMIVICQNDFMGKELLALQMGMVLERE